ncbi:DNA-binding protein [Priestia megaterium]|uniref:DNA-binding protein n=1 Tax=Priestia megaterium TaxID=1404 RepID=UPI00203DD3B2|nr:DNA-binding protein [Priestia megaterium]MCM3308857.1 DNA-binding protein [Priestia megaterium]
MGVNAFSNASEYGYFAKDMAANLEVTTSTLRRWSIRLEKAGYKFERNEKDQRIYYERDFKAFRELKKLISNNVVLVDAIVSMDVEVLNASQTPSVYREETRLTKQFFEELLDKKINKAIQQAFEEGRQQGREEIKEIINKMEQRAKERDDNLMSVIRSIQGEKKKLNN